MLKGDLATTPLPDVLMAATEGNPTGCLHIVRADGEEALVYVKNGLVYSAYVPGRRPQLGARLVSSGAIAPEALEEALEAQATELQGWRLGELLVHLGYVERPVVEAFVVEQLRESIYDLTLWTEGRWRFRKGEKTREDVGGSSTVGELLSEADRRATEWLVLNESVHGPHAVPVLSAGGLGAAEMTLDQDQWALLCKVDGERSIAELARDCGFTVFEAGTVVHQLVRAGLLEVEESLDEAAPVVTAAPGPARLASAIASLLGDTADHQASTPAEEEEEPLGAFEEEVTSFEDDTPTMSRLTGALLVPITGNDVAETADVAAVDADDLADDLDEGGSELSRLLGAYSAAAPAVAEDEAETAYDATADASAAADAAATAAAGFELPDLMVPELPPSAAAPEDESFSDSLAEVSAALSTLLGESSATDRPPVVDDSADTDEGALAEAVRLANAAELQAMQAEEHARRAREDRERVAAEEAARVAEAARQAAEAAEAAAAELVRQEAAIAAAEVARLAAEAAEQARRDAEEQARRDAEEQARRDAEEQARRDAEEQARRDAEEQARRDAEEQARRDAEQAFAELTAAVDDTPSDDDLLSQLSELAVAADSAELVDQAEDEPALTLLAPGESMDDLAAYEVVEHADPASASANGSAADAAAMLRDIAADSAPPATPPGDDLVADLDEVVVDGPEPDEAPPAFARPAHTRDGNTDTASLLRELSSLGLDDEPSSMQAQAANAAVKRPPSNAPTPTSKNEPKKRKGLFGRG